MWLQELRLGRAHLDVELVSGGDDSSSAPLPGREQPGKRPVDASGGRAAVVDAAGTAVRFEPGQSRDVSLVPIAGTRHVFGFNQQVMGAL